MKLTEKIHLLPITFEITLVIFTGLMWACTESSPVERQTSLLLDGQWSVGESMEADIIPSTFDHTVPVPGLTNQAQPAFEDVDQYESHEFIYTMKLNGVMSENVSNDEIGRIRQNRNFFWYKRMFRVPDRREHATLIVNKAQFGTAVWLNGHKIGEHVGCFTAGRFDLSNAINWDGNNQLVIRIGAHPGAMGDTAFWGSDGEKEPWTPGIYDRVELRLADNAVIEEVQVAPRILSSEIVIQTTLKNFGAARTVKLKQQVKAWKDKQAAGKSVHMKIQLAAGEEKTITQTVQVKNPRLWSPETPFLYTLETNTGGDNRSTRFGMREFRFDTVTHLPMLNGKVYYLRGASITLHRFFGDSLCGGLPWNEAWVRKLLVDIPKRMHMNAFRICIGPAPQQWLDIADEAGLLLQYEFPIWSDRPALPTGEKRHELWNEDDITEQMGEFIRDNWNHPSVVIWDASNETRWDFLREKLVPAVRSLDLSGRPWENGYLEPYAPEDPYETHPYKFINHWSRRATPPYFQMSDLEKPLKPETGWRADHAAIINEYDWLWLHRDGTPTILTRKIYHNLLGPNPGPQQRFALNGYLLGGLTEFWRSTRQYAGVLYLAYLDGDLPNAFTCDNFADLSSLKLEPNFEKFMSEAFKPLGVCIDFWQSTLSPGSKDTIQITLINDTYESADGLLTLNWEGTSDGSTAEIMEKHFDVKPLGRSNYEFELAAPASEGQYLLTAKATWGGKPFSPTLSCRQVTVTSFK